MGTLSAGQVVGACRGRTVTGVVGPLDETVPLGFHWLVTDLYGGRGDTKDYCWTPSNFLDKQADKQTKNNNKHTK